MRSAQGVLEVEAEAAWLLRDFDPLRPPSAERLARHHLGPDAVRVQRQPHDGEVRLDERAIFIRPGLSPVRQREVVCHELGHVRLAAVDYWEIDVEDRADQLGAALVAPRAAFRAALAHFGPRFDRLARAFIATETLVAIRYGEVTGRPLVVLTPTRLHVRGEDNAWPPEPELRALAKTRRLPSGVELAPLSDPKRMVLMVG